MSSQRSLFESSFAQVAGRTRAVADSRVAAMVLASQAAANLYLPMEVSWIKYPSRLLRTPYSSDGWRLSRTFSTGSRSSAV